MFLRHIRAASYLSLLNDNCGFCISQQAFFIWRGVKTTSILVPMKKFTDGCLYSIVNVVPLLLPPANAAW